MNVTAASAAGAASPAQSASAVAGKDLSQNFDNFLNLLITQLQNQDPLSPMDTNEFTSQIVQFAAVEQAIATNTNLESMLGLQRTNQAAGMVDYLGKRIEAQGDTTALAGGVAEWNYRLPENAETVKLLVTDANGNPVYTGTGAVSAGSHTLLWDGHDNGGNQLPDGSYTLSVTATNSNGEKIATDMTVVGTVSGIETSGDEPVLYISGIGVPLSEVISVLQPRATTTPAA